MPCFPFSDVVDLVLMGKSFSKILDVHEAQARCTAEEWERFSNGFDRISKDGKLDEASFRIEVLPGGIPKQLALRIFEVFDYKSRGHLKKNEFLCGMTILSHGTPDERIKFLFYIYDIENTGFLSKEILYRIAAVLQESESSSESSLELINTLFEDIGETQAINFQQFKSWAHSNISSVLIYWIWEICPRYPTANSSECIGWDDLLNRDDGSSKINLEESSSQSKSIWFARRSSIASLTHFNEQEITDIEKYYLKISSKFSIIDRENFKYLFNELTSLPEELCIKLFDAFDLDRDGNMDVKEFIVGLSTACRGTDSEKLFCKQSPFYLNYSKILLIEFFVM